MPNIKKVVEGVRKRYVSIDTKKAIGSGVILVTNFVLTCFHNLYVDSGIKVGKEEAEIVDVDPLHDLTLLMVKTKELERVILNKAGLGEVVFSFGNPMGLDGALLFGRVVFKTDQRVISDIHGQPGVSGSGLFNLQGELLGINHSVIGKKHIGSWLLCATPSENMGKILSDVFEVVPATAEEVEMYAQTVKTP